MNKIFASRPCCWAPGLETPSDWQEWLSGNKGIENTEDAPSLSFTSPLFRRRLGQLCRMTVQVVHDILEQTGCGDIKQVFISKRGDIKREFTVNKTLIEDNTVLPAAFSLSVFNAPIALASIACNLKSGYSAIFPSNGSFSSAVLAAAAPVLSGHEDKIILVYGDEAVPVEYGKLSPEDEFPMAFATVLSAKEDSVCTIPTAPDTLQDCTAESFLRHILK